MKFLILSAILTLASALPSEYLPGGLFPIEVDSPQLLDALEHVQDDLNARLNSPYYHKIVKVLAAQSQVVAGELYHVDLEFAQTDCLKSKVTKETASQCKEVSNIQVCSAKILSQPWLNNLIRTEEFHCKPTKQEVSYDVFVGGRQKMDVKEPSLMEMLIEVEAKINAQLSSPYYNKVTKIVSAESQVVAGIMYYIDFEIASTQCLKEKVTKENRTMCNVSESVQICEAHIISQPWMKVLEVTSLKCTAKTL